MARQLESAGVVYTRIPARDGRDPDVLRRSRRSPLAALSAGAVGCFESHILAWETLLASADAAAVVLEDDVVIASDFMETVRAALPLDFDVVKLDLFHRQVRVENRPLPLSGGRSAYRFLGLDWCTGGYLISRRGAKRLLRAAQGYTRAVDQVMFGEWPPLYSAKVFSVIPAVCVQTSLAEGVEEMPSTIEVWTLLPKTPWKRLWFRARAWSRMESGPLARLRRQWALRRAQHGVAVVENTFSGAQAGGSNAAKYAALADRKTDNERA